MSRIVNLDSFGDWSLSDQVFGWILAHVPAGGVVFELGFGKATGELIRAGYVVYSVEHCGVWAEKREEIVGDSQSHTLIEVPIKNGWYDVEALAPRIPMHYDLLIVDGPDTIERHHLLDNKQLFNKYSSVVVDDYCEQYKTAQVAAYFAHTNGVAIETFCGNGKAAMCIKGRGNGY